MGDAGVVAAGEGERLEGPWAWTAQDEGKAADAQQQVWWHRASYTLYNIDTQLWSTVVVYIMSLGG